MPPATTRGNSVLGPKSIAAFALGVAVGVAMVAPVLPTTVGPVITGLLASGGTVILTGVGALGLLMVLLAVFYQLYL